MSTEDERHEHDSRYLFVAFLLLASVVLAVGIWVWVLTAG